MQVPRWRRNPWCCAALHSVTKNLHVALDSYWFDNLGFLVRENLLLYASHLPLGVPNGRVIHALSSTFSGAVAGELKKSYTTNISNSHVNYTPASSFSGAVAGEIKTRCKGSLPHPISLLCFCLALLYLLTCLLHYIKTQKN